MDRLDAGAITLPGFEVRVLERCSSTNAVLLEEIRSRLSLAMLFITHDLRVAAQVCDHVAVMQNGRIVEHGPVGEVFLAPKHAYTRALFASAPGREFAFGKVN